MPKKQTIAVLLPSAKIPTDHTTVRVNLDILAMDGHAWVNIDIFNCQTKSKKNNKPEAYDLYSMCSNVRAATKHLIYFQTMMSVL